MDKTKINPQIIQQLRQMGGEVVLEKEEEKKEDGGYEEEKEHKIDKGEILQMKTQKEVWAKKRREEIEAEIKKLIEERKQQLSKRREEAPQKIQEQKIAEEQKKELPPEISSKPKKGLPFWGKRIKTAQQQAQPETVDRRVGG